MTSASSFVRAALRRVGKGTKKQPVTIEGKEVACQPFMGWCGPMCLRYMLMKWGYDVPVEALHVITECTKTGTTSAQMCLGAWTLGFDSVDVSAHKAAGAKSAIDRCLKRGASMLVSVDDDEHWIAVMSRTKRGYLVFDPDKPGPIITLVGWKRLERRMRIVGLKETTYELVSIERPVQR